MKKNVLRMLTAIFLCGLTALQTACSLNDNPAGGQAQEDIVGLWISTTEESGVVSNDNLEYNQVVKVLQFNADGTGFHELFYVMDGEDVVSCTMERYAEESGFVYNLNGKTADYRFNVSGTGSATLSDGRLTDADGTAYERGSDLDAIVTEAWATLMHGGSDDYSFTLLGTAAKPDDQRVLHVTENPTKLTLISDNFLLRRDLMLQLDHGGTVDFRGIRLCPLREDQWSNPMLAVNGDEELTLSVHSDNMLQGHAKSAISTRGNIKMKGNGRIKLSCYPPEEHEYHMRGITAANSFSTLAAEGYTVSTSFYPPHYDYTVKPKDVVPMSEVSAMHVGCVIGSNGMVYATKSDAQAAKTKCEAMIVYVGKGDGFEHGLALSMVRANKEQRDSLFRSEDRVKEFAQSHAVKGATWRMPTKDEVMKMLEGCAGTSAAEYPGSDWIKYAVANFSHQLNWAFDSQGQRLFIPTTTPGAKPNTTEIFLPVRGKFDSFSNSMKGFPFYPFLAF